MVRLATQHVTVNGQVVQVGEVTRVPAGLRGRCGNARCVYHLRDLETDGSETGPVTPGYRREVRGRLLRTRPTHTASWFLKCPGCKTKVQFHSGLPIRN